MDRLSLNSKVDVRGPGDELLRAAPAQWGPLAQLGGQGWTQGGSSSWEDGICKGQSTSPALEDGGPARSVPMTDEGFRQPVEGMGRGSSGALHPAFPVYPTASGEQI